MQSEPVLATSRRSLAQRLDEPLPRLLADRVLPALLFAWAAAVRGSRALEMVERAPPVADAPAWTIYLLAFGGETLAFLFCGLVATLMLNRRARVGSRATPSVLTVALAGTFLMNGVLIQSPTTRDWLTLALADVLLVAGLAFSIYAAASLGDCFGLASEARGLVTTGAFRVIRHPLYLGEMIAALGILLPVLAPTTVLIYAAFCACQIRRALLEERALAVVFPEYEEYRRQTPAWLPVGMSAPR